MLSVENITAERGERILFRNISFTLESGQALAIRGPNGSGKTTLLRILAGLIPPLSGYLDYFVENTLYIGHKNALSSYLTPKQTLDFWADIFDVRAGTPDKITQILEQFELAQRANDVCAALSQGQLKRLSLSRIALLAHKIWLLDEPLSGLDQAGVAILEAQIDAHLKGGGIAVAATHTDIRFIDEQIDISDFSRIGEKA